MNTYLSIVIPLHNERLRLRETVYNVIRYCEREFHGRYEILLIENGSTDGTFDVAQELSGIYRPVRVYHLDVRSKASAVRYGMIQARGEYRYMCDADLSTPIEELPKFFTYIRDGWDVVIGSREHIDSNVETSFKRWFIGRTFHLLAQLFTGVDFRDTQCGFKLFNASAANEIFSRSECNSMAFDVEALHLAQLYGYYVTDIPVTWNNDPDSRVRLVRDSWLMLKDLMQITRIHLKDRPFYKQKIPA